jgi:hypothetical protein
MTPRHATQPNPNHQVPNHRVSQHRQASTNLLPMPSEPTSTVRHDVARPSLQWTSSPNTKFPFLPDSRAAPEEGIISRTDWIRRPHLLCPCSLQRTEGAKDPFLRCCFGQGIVGTGTLVFAMFGKERGERKKKHRRTPSANSDSVQYTQSTRRVHVGTLYAFYSGMQTTVSKSGKNL